MWTLLVGEFSFQISAAKLFLSPFLLWIILPTAHCRVYHTQIPDSRRHEFGFGGVACVSDSGPIREEGSCQDMSNQLYRHCGICLKIASRSWCLHWIFNFWCTIIPLKLQKNWARKEGRVEYCISIEFNLCVVIFGNNISFGIWPLVWVQSMCDDRPVTSGGTKALNNPSNF